MAAFHPMKPLRTPKTHLTTGTLPPYIEPTQPPTKKPPWLQINDVSFVSRLTLTLPNALYSAISPALTAPPLQPRYAKVILKLTDILETHFLDLHIKRGDILMLSEGTPGVDNTFLLRDGILRMNLDKATYERTGLQGRVVRSGSRKHVKHRFEIEIDLRQPSMVHGKKGFGRIVWAAKNVLDRSLVWLYVDLEARSSTDDVMVEGLPIARHHPTWVNVEHEIVTHAGVSVPDAILNAELPTIEEEDLYDTIEWLDLLALSSPCVLADSNAKLDPYLCRYTPPDCTASPVDLHVIRWEGMLSSKWARELLMSLITQSRKAGITASSCWAAISVVAHRTDVLGQTDGYTTMLNSPTDTGLNASGDGQDDNTMAVDRPANETGSRTTGLRFYRCFEHVDS